MRRALLVTVVVVVLAAGLGPRLGTARASAPTVVFRDHYGVPHIEAPSLQAASYAMGYVTAQDRLLEMDIFRKLSQGRLSEYVGPPMLPMDELIRREFVLPAGIDAQYQALDPTVRSMLDAYTKGINDAAVKTYLDPRTRPALYDVLGMPWEPWKPQDSLLIAMIFASDLFGGDGAAGQLANAAILQRLQARYGGVEGLKVFDDVYPGSFGDAPTIIASGEGPPAPSGYDVTGPVAVQQPAIDTPGVQAIADSQASVLTQAKALLRRFGIPVPHLGSFGAAVSGGRTASHGGLLMGSPQAGLESPPIFYEVGYHVPGVTDCEGIAVPGLGPAIAIGWCNQHAWTLIAANVGDQADLYAERLDPNQPHRYFFDGAWRATVQRSTTYIVKGVFTCSTPCPPEVVTRTYDYTVHGPISAVDQSGRTGFAYRRAQTGLAGVRNLEAAVAENLAKSYTAFRDGVDIGSATLHLLYADAGWHIAYRFTGLQPVRAPGVDRRFPVPGTGAGEWRGFLTACQMPSVVDPSAGYLAVNQGTESKPIWWWPNSPSIGIGIVARPRHDQQLLAGLGPDTLEVQRQLEHRYLMEDDPQAALFYPLFAKALSASSDPVLRGALAQLNAWKADGFRRTDRNGDGHEDHPGLAIFEMDHYDEYGNGPAYPTPLGDAMVSAAFAGPVGSRLPGTTAMGRYSALYDALTHRLSRDYVGDTDAFIRAAVRGVVATLSRQFGTADMTRWHDTYPQVTFTAIGLTSPPPIRGFDHGSYSQIVDLGARAGENVEPAGDVAADSVLETAEISAGQPPAHYMDQWQLYEDYRYKPMLMSPSQYRTHAESVTVLNPPASLGATTRLALSGRDPCRVR